MHWQCTQSTTHLCTLAEDGGKRRVACFGFLCGPRLVMRKYIFDPFSVPQNAICKAIFENKKAPQLVQWLRLPWRTIAPYIASTNLLLMASDVNDNRSTTCTTHAPFNTSRVHLVAQGAWATRGSKMSQECQRWIGNHQREWTQWSFLGQEWSATKGPGVYLQTPKNALKMAHLGT